MTEETSAGPIDYLVVEWPPGSPLTGEAFPHLVDLVDRGLIRILDLAFISKGEDGTVSGLTLADLDGDGVPDLAVFDGVQSGLLGEEDQQEAGNALEPGASGAVLIYENLWAAPFASALRRNGAELVAAGRIPADDILEALDALESDES